MKETNMEHFRGEIEAILNKKEVIAISKLDGSIFACNEDECDQCICCNGRDEELIPCDVTLMRWLMSEYKPEPVLTARERGFIECVGKGYISRDKDGALGWSEDKVEKSEADDCWVNGYDRGFATLNRDTFKFITWEDEEPWAVADLRKLKVKAGDQDA